MKSYRVLTIKQPWAHLIINGIKRVENRSWKTDYRGLILIHAGQAYDESYQRDRTFGVDPAQLIYGAVIGTADLVDIVTEHSSPFFVGPFGWVLENARPIEPIPLRGQQRLFNAKLTLPAPRRRR
jgi:hypothetical protein